MTFGVKIIVPVTDKRFQSYPFVPVSFCSTKDKNGVYTIAGYGIIYKQITPTRWEMVEKF
jgi:hypothetical protein